MMNVLGTGTCAVNCWMAKEEVCRCLCGGANHGIMREGGEQPERTKQKSGILYRLVAVTGYYAEADILVMGDYGSWLRSVGFHSEQRYPHERVIKNLATKSQRKWTEVQAVKGQGRFDEKYLVWERIDSPRTW